MRVEGCGLSQCVLFVCGVAPSELKRQRILPYVYGLISGGQLLYPKEDLVVPLGGVCWGELKRMARRPCQRKMLSSRGGEVRAVFVCISIVVFGVLFGRNFVFVLSKGLWIGKNELFLQG